MSTRRSFAAQAFILLVVAAAARPSIAAQSPNDASARRGDRGSADHRPLPETRAAPAALGSITGRVTDAATGQPLALAQVSVGGTVLGRVTDDSGRYSIPGVPAGLHQVTAKRVGYAAMTVNVTVSDGGTATADFALGHATTTLTAVVATVTGQEERFKVGNVIGSIGADTVLRGAPINTVTDLLAARVPGLQIYYAGGASGTTSPIRIRGTNSMTVANDPIFIVDGIRVESSTGGGSGRGRLSDLSLYEIETLDVVKGPAAATLYGTDAANGVIVITTKRGSAGPARWRLWSEQGTLKNTAVFEDQYWAYGHTPTGAQTHCTLSLLAQGNCVQDSLVKWNSMLDKALTPLTTGYKRVYGAQASGGVQNFNYFLSGELNDETGYLKMPALEQARIKAQRGVTSLPDYELRPNWADLVNLRANVGSTLNDRAHVQLSSGLIFNSTSIPSNSLYSQAGYRAQPATAANFGWTLGAAPGEVFSVKNVDNTTRFTSSASGDYQPFAWLGTRGTVGLDWSGTTTDILQKNGEGPTSTNVGSRQDNRYDIKLWSVDLGANATHQLRPWLNSRTAVGAQYNRRLEYDVRTTGTTLAPGAETLSGAATLSSSESTTETIVAGAYVEQNLAFYERFFFIAGLRLDGGSAFGAKFSTTAYPKVSLSWLGTDGTSGGWPSWVSNFRLRGAIGSSGVQPSAVASLQRDALGPAVVNGVALVGATLQALGNPNLKPERQTELEGGIDADFFRSAVKVELTAYRRTSSDAIVNQPLPPSAAGLSVPINLGKVRNQGIEGFISVRPLDTRPASLDLSLNGSVNKNRLLTVSTLFPCNILSCNRVGYPILSVWGRPSTYNDANGDGILALTELTVDTTFTFQGPVRPTRTAAGTAALGLFGDRLRMSAMIDYKGGYILPDGIQNNACPIGTCRAVNDPKAPLELQAAAIAAQKNFSLWRYNYDGTFARLREVSVSVRAPQSFASRIGARGADLSISGRNLGIFWNKFPDTIAEAGGSDINYNNPTPPLAKYWILRLMLDY